MTISWSRRARQHLIDLRNYVELDKPDAAERLGQRIVDCAQILAQQPLAGRAGRVPGTRELVVVGTPYVIPYRIRARTIELLAVFHGRQKWPKRL